MPHTRPTGVIKILSSFKILIGSIGILSAELTKRTPSDCFFFGDFVHWDRPESLTFILKWSKVMAFGSRQGITDLRMWRILNVATERD